MNMSCRRDRLSGSRLSRAIRRRLCEMLAETRAGLAVESPLGSYAWSWPESHAMRLSPRSLALSAMETADSRAVDDGDLVVVQ